MRRADILRTRAPRCVALFVATLAGLWSFAGTGATAPAAQARTADQLLADRPLAPTGRAMFDTLF